ncbi:MAG: hypothetical protein KDB85_12625, partial [Chitinophagales bacterium]|nr:hypothetical protein [Chitinophagales bacterium]
MDRREAIKIIDSGVICSLQVVKCDRHRKRGGQLTDYPSVQKILSSDDPAVNTTPGHHIASGGRKKNPRHSENATRN